MIFYVIIIPVMKNMEGGPARKKDKAGRI